MVEFRTLGTVTLQATDPERDCASVLAQPKRIALLAYLALARPHGLHSRDAILALFWPERSQRHASKALNQALYFLRRRLGPELFVREGHRVGLQAERWWCDAVEFDRRLERGERETALELYAGELLPAFYAADTAPFERWLEEERSRLRSRALDAAIAVASDQAERSQWLEEIHWLKRARDLAPYDEPLAVRLVERMLRLGDRSGALRELAEFERRIARDLGAGGTSRLRALRARLDAARDPEPRPPLTLDASPASPPPGRHLHPEPREAPAPAGSDIEPQPTLEASSESIGGSSRVMVRIAAAALLGLVAGFAGGPQLLPESDAASRASLDSRRILVVDFADETRQADQKPLGRIAADWIAQELAASGLVSPIPSAAVARDLLEPGEALGAAVDEARATELALRSGAGLMVTGSYYSVGDSLEFHARLIDVSSGDLVRRIEGSRVTRADFLDGIDALRGKLVGALATAVDPRLVKWSNASSQPPDLEAYRLYADGLDAFFRDDPDAALTRLLAAGARDSAFTAPLLWAVRLAVEVERHDRADSLLAVLEARRSTMPAWDRAMFDHLTARVHGTWEDLRRTARRLVDIAPGSEWLLWLARASLYGNRPAEALQAHDRMDPDQGWLRDRPYHWRLRADARHRLGQYVEELDELSLWRDMLPGSALHVELRALAALGRTADHAAVLETGLVGLDPLERAHRLFDAAEELAVHGHADAAGRLRKRAVTEAGDASGEFPERPTPRAGVLYRGERWEEAQAAFLESPGLKEDLRRVRLGRIAARRGDREEALRVSKWLDSENSRFSRGWHTMERALIHAALGDRETALQLIRRAIGEGHGFYTWLHTIPELEPLRGWAPFEDLMRPKG